MLACRKARGLMAAAVYDDLTDEERIWLDAHTAACAGCRARAQAFCALADAVPVHPVPPLERDLAPLVRRRVFRAEFEANALRARRWAFGAAAASALLILLVSMPFLGIHPANSAAPATPVVAQASPLAREIERGERLATDRDYTAAYLALKKAVARYPKDPLAGEAQQQCADIAFARLRWYPEAFDEYETLYRDYYPLFSADTASKQRRELLAETRQQDFAPLYALDMARGASADAFAKLEDVIVRYPATYVASMAAENMAELAADEPSSSHLAAMEQARNRCKNPLAIAQLNVEIGHICVRELNDPGQARSFYLQAAQQTETPLGRLAKESLARLDAPPAP